MAAVFELSHGLTTVNAANTAFFPAGDSGMSLVSTEAQGTLTRRSAGTTSGLYVRIATNSLSGASTLTLRKNLLATATQTLSIGAGLTGEFQDVVNTDAFATGDQCDFKLVVGAGTNIIVSSLGLVFAATSNTVKRFVNSAAYSPTTSNNYVPLAGGQGSLQTTEASVQHTVRAPGTLQNLYVECSANTASLSCSVVSRLDTANGAMAVSIGAGLTGAFEDLVHSDTVVSGSLVNYASSLGIGSTGAITVRMFSAELSTVTSQTEFAGGAASGQTQATSLTWLYAIAGSTSGSSRTVESSFQVAAQIAATLSRMRIRLSGNGVSAASIATLRKNAGPGNQTISLTANTTGLFEDLVNSDVVSVSDEINYQIVTGGTGTSLVVGSIGLLSATNNWLKQGYWWQSTTASSGEF